MKLTKKQQAAVTAAMAEGAKGFREGLLWYNGPTEHTAPYETCLSCAWFNGWFAELSKSLDEELNVVSVAESD